MDISYEKLQDKYVLEYYAALDCPRSLACWMLYKHREHKQLVEIDFEPLFYNDLGNARDSLAATKFLSKAVFLKTEIDLRKKALDGFLEAERVCGDTNTRIRRYKFENPYTLSVLSNMIGKIRAVLGRFNPEDFVDSCNWGPGASTLITRANASYPRKFDVERHITPRAYEFVKDWFGIVYPHWEMMFEIRHSSKIVTVPKNAKTDRVIAVEPGINLWFQKGIGNMIRRRLKGIGIDLNDQSHNQRLARIGSKFNRLATVDFSAASDTIASALVEELLPREWFSVMHAFKVDYTSLDGQTIKLNKFSSMGNGFTFELESLIFWSLAASVSEQLGLEGEVSVYGDDVILPSSAIDLFSACSKDLGFSVNIRKSYSSGMFRESCGAYYWGGRSIKPIFQKEPLNGKTSLLKAANNVRRYAHSRNSYGCDHHLRRCWQVLVRSLGADVPKIAEGYGDLGLVVNPDERDRCHTVTRAKHGHEGFHTRVWSLLACQRFFDTPGLLLYKLKSIGALRDFDPLRIADKGDSGNAVPLNGRYKYTRMRIFIPTWPDLGPWV